MAVLGRVLLHSAERIDLPDLLSIDSYGAGDWKYFMQSLVGTTRPYILSGFDIINPGNAIGLPSCSFRVADSIVYYPGSAAGPFFYGLPEGESAAEPLVPQLRTNATNYVYLTLSTFETSIDTRALWDPDRNGGDGGEFTQDINTESVIEAQLGISTGSFPVNTVPLAIIVVGPATITSITDARDLMFRLGTGGIAPNPSATFAFPALPDANYARQEANGTMTSLSDPNPFQGGDKNIKTLKQWMDAIMTKLKELGGTTYWYQDTTTFSLYKLFHDALATAWKSKGAYTHSSATPGELSWSEDLYIKSMDMPVDIVIRASGGSPIQLENEQVAFIELIRDQPVNALDETVSFTNNQAYVNSASGATGLFANLKKGDWIKKATDGDNLFLQVREFYNAAQSPGPVTGSVTTAGDARSITLSDTYEGTSSDVVGDKARYWQGEYETTDIQIVDRNNSLLIEAAGNMLWFAQRSDTIMAVDTIAGTLLSGTITVADGTSATVSATGHGLIDGDRVEVYVPGAQAGTYTVDVVDTNNFTFKTTNTTTGSFSGSYGLCTTEATTVNSFQLESANHGFDSGETVIISDTVEFNGPRVVNVRSTTQFQFPSAAGVLPAPTWVDSDILTSGGSLADNTTYSYVATAVNANGETIASVPLEVVVPELIPTDVIRIYLQVDGINGATAYRFYGRTAGNEEFLGQVAAPTLTFIDDGSITPSGEPPTANTTFGPIAAETVGFATLARMDVRSEEGIQKIVQGETIEIGSGTIENMQQFIGMTALDQTYPVYTLPSSYGTLNGGANYNSLVTDNLTTRVAKNTAMLMDKAQDKTVKYLTTAVEAFVEVDANPSLQNLSFTPPSSTLTILQPGSVGNAVVTLPDVGAPLQLAVNQSAYVTINRNAATTPGFTIAATTAVPVSENVFVIASRLAGSEIFLWNSLPVLNTVPLAPSDVPLVQCDFFDPLSTTLPTGNPVTIDNVSVQANELVVFGALSSNPNRMYKAVGVGTNITSWTAQYKFNGELDPTNADTILVRKGDSFTRQIGIFNGTDWEFNAYVRYFNGADYFEQSGLHGVTADDNARTTIFSVAWAGSEHIIVDFSVVRGTLRETGTMHIVTDGSVVEVSTDGSYVNGNSGVVFEGTISGADLVLEAVTTSTGTDAQVKYSIRRWSSSFPGGPAGVPSYSGAAPAPTPAASPVNAVQFNSAGVLAGNSNFTIDTVDISQNYNGLRQGVLSGAITIVDNMAAATNLVLLSASYSSYILDYSIVKEGFRRTGHMVLAYDGTNVSINEVITETGATGVVLSAIVSGGIQLQYTSTNGAGDGTFKYAWRKWV